MSISLLDMKYIYGLPIFGEPYEECVLKPEHMKIEANYPSSLRDLYAAYDKLLENDKAIHRAKYFARQQAGERDAQRLTELLVGKSGALTGCTTSSTLKASSQHPPPKGGLFP